MGTRLLLGIFGLLEPIGLPLCYSVRWTHALSLSRRTSHGSVWFVFPIRLINSSYLVFVGGRIV